MSTSEFVWGAHVVTLLAQRKPHLLRQVWIEDKHQSKYQAVIALLEQHSVPTDFCAKKVLDQKLKEVPHQGIAASVVPTKPESQAWLMELVQTKSDPLIVFLDEVQDPHNLGAVLRSACAFGVDCVVSTVKNAAPLSGVARKAASGGDLFVPYVQVTNLARAIEEVKKQGVWVVGTSLSEQAKPLGELSLTGPLAIILGAEGKGLRHKTEAICDYLGYIPMTGAVQSLNVSVACGISLYQCFIQRSN